MGLCLIGSQGPQGFLRYLKGTLATSRAPNGPYKGSRAEGPQGAQRDLKVNNLRELEGCGGN